MENIGEVVVVMQGLSVDVHGLADGLKGLVEAGLAKAAGAYDSTQCPYMPAGLALGTLQLAMTTHCAAVALSCLHLTSDLVHLPSSSLYNTKARAWHMHCCLCSDGPKGP